MVLFGICWTVVAYFITHAPKAMSPGLNDSPAGTILTIVGIIVPLFGVCFVVIGILSVVYSIQNAFSKNRTSLVDIETSIGESILSDLTPGNRTLEVRLRDLEELKSKGMLTLKEYTDQRTRILNSL